MMKKSWKKAAAVSAVAAFLCPMSPSANAQEVRLTDQPIKRVFNLDQQKIKESFSPTAPNVGYEKIKVPNVLQSAPTNNQMLKPLAVQPPFQNQRGPVKPSFAPGTIPVQQVSTTKSTVKNPESTIANRMTAKLDSLIQTSINSPRFVNVNKEATIKIDVTNTANIPVNAVGFTAVLPTHTKLISATPTPSAIDGQVLKFDLDSINPRDAREIILRVQPTVREPIDIMTSVRTETEQKVLVAVREPQLSVVINGPRQINVGDNVTHEVIVSNIGDGIATGVIIHTDFPEQLLELNSSLKESIAPIEPGKSVKVIYESQAIGSGPIEVKSTARSDDGAEPKLTSAAMTVFEPKLQISAIGPKVNFVNRNGIYTLNLENNGKVDITDVQVSLVVPTGMKITTISREAKVDASKGVLHWSFERIPAGSTEQIQMMSTVTEEGDQVCNFLVDSHETGEKQIQLTTRVTTRADVAVQIKNLSGPVQVGGKALFEVQVTNRGSRKATDVNVRVELPESLQAVPMDSQKVVIEGNTVLFTEPQIAPEKATTFKFTAIGKAGGEHVVRTITQSDGSERRTTAEDTVFVYEVDEARVSESLTPSVLRR
jgi:uncharacterized repeat protein (TIGR01451 family)